MLCHKEYILYDALKIINDNGKGIVFIVDDSNNVCGVLTDGDIRSGLLKGYDLKEPVKNLMNADFVYAFNDQSANEIIAKTSEKIKIIPILNKDFKYIDLFEYSSRVYIPIANPKFGGNELKYLTDAFLSTWISSKGKYLDLFESEYAKFCECDYGISVSNGTAALHLALLALSIGEGDEVIVPNLTFAAAINTVLHANASPVIVDVEKDSWCISPEEIEKAITPKTKAIMAVHLYGQPCDMEQIGRIAHDHRLFVIEDCAEAHGATFEGKKVGSMGDVGCFSFYGNKIITTGEGGMCVTKSPELDAKIRVLRDHGMSKTKRYWHDKVGYNYRMTNLQAAIGLAQLERIEEILNERSVLENKYRETLKEVDIIEFQCSDLSGRKKITWLVSALLKLGNRDKLLKHLSSMGIDSRPFFYPLSEMDIYKKYLFSNVNSIDISKKGFNFPTSHSVNQDVLAKIKASLLSFNRDV